MIKNTQILLVLVIGLFSLFAVTTEVHAQSTGLTYQLLEKIPGTADLSGTNLAGYIQAIYRVALIVVTLSAVFMITVGGFMYLTSAGNTSAMSSAKGIIFDALIGLIIALCAWLVLYVINPDLVKTAIPTLGPVIIAPPEVSGGPVGPPPSGSDQDLARQIIARTSITLKMGGDCKSPNGMVSSLQNLSDIAEGRSAAKCSNGCTAITGCVDNAVNLSHNMLVAILTVGQTKAFTIQSITGGSHVASSSHYSGNAIDITPVSQALLDAFVAAGARAPSGNATSMCERVINKVATSVDCNSGGANHIHLVF